MMQPKTRKILVVIHDPGGTKAILPVLIQLIRDSRFIVQVLAGPFAASLVERQGIAFIPVESNVSAEQVFNWFEYFRPDVLFSGTSWNANVEQQCRNEAFRRATSSIVVLDFWANYRLRWQGATYDIANLPDRVCVMDEATQAEMVAEGFPVQVLFVTGHPYLDFLSHGHLNQTGSRHKQDTSTVLFLSQPFSNDVVISGLQHALKIAGWMSKADSNVLSKVLVKPHPKEDFESIQSGINHLAVDSNISIGLIGKETPVEEAIFQAEVVIGFNTIALLEARAFGKQVYAMEVLPFGKALKMAMQQANIILINPNEENFMDWSRMNSVAANYSFTLYKGATEKILTILSKENQLV